MPLPPIRVGAAAPWLVGLGDEGGRTPVENGRALAMLLSEAVEQKLAAFPKRLTAIGGFTLTRFLGSRRRLQLVRIGTPV
jgi:hypothetical protein